MTAFYCTINYNNNQKAKDRTSTELSAVNKIIKDKKVKLKQVQKLSRDILSSYFTNILHLYFHELSYSWSSFTQAVKNFESEYPQLKKSTILAQIVEF